MKVVVKQSAVTYVDGVAHSLAIGETVDLPSARAKALVAAGIVEAVAAKSAPETKPRAKSAPETK
jgi:hypothetical protein